MQNLRTIKKLVLGVAFSFILIRGVGAQQRGSSIGISFLFFDYETPARIKASSLRQVLKEGEWADLQEMSPGLAITYFRQLHARVDFASTLSGAFVDNALPNQTIPDNAFLLQADATLQFNVLPQRFMVTPYLIAGVGASKFKGYFGAYMPFGTGIKVNFFDEAAFFINARYHLPVNTATVNRHFIYGLGIAGKISR